MADPRAAFSPMPQVAPILATVPLQLASTQSLATGVQYVVYVPAVS